MTITVQSDTIGGQAGSITSNGPTATRVFKVLVTAGESIMEVLADSNIPQYYDIHPDTGGTGQFAAIYALEISCAPEQEQNDIFIVTVNYGRPDFSQKEPGETASDSLIQCGSSVSSAKTQKDNTNTQLTVSLTGFDDQVGEVEIQVPQTVLLFERKEPGSPLSKAIANTGNVNSVALGGGTYAARTLLCLGIEGVSQDDGETWQVSYRFQYRPETWDAVMVYIDSETDRPHESIDLGTNDGVTVAEIYPEANFSTLNLDF